MQMYCTFVLFVNQHFPGLPASGTHCTSPHVPGDHSLVNLKFHTWFVYKAISDHSWTEFKRITLSTLSRRLDASSNIKQRSE
jgi:hypothetical protein